MQAALTGQRNLQKLVLETALQSHLLPLSLLSIRDSQGSKLTRLPELHDKPQEP